MQKELLKYKYISITRNSPYFSASFNQPYRLVNEGGFYRLGDMHIIDKNNMVDVKVEENVMKITYSDGKVVELGIARLSHPNTHLSL